MFSDLELIILSVLSESNQTLAGIEDALGARGVRDWLVYSRSSIVDVLKRLIKQDFVSVSPAGAQSVFAITEAGYGGLQTALVELLHYPSLMNGFALAISGLRALRPAQVSQTLKARRAALNAQTDALLRSLTDRSRSEEEAAMLSYLLEITRAENEWLDDFLKGWARRFPAVTAPIEPQYDPMAERVNPRAATASPLRTRPIRNTGALQWIRRPAEDER
jgi:DNA-binding PadR family transcriptional regulator